MWLTSARPHRFSDSRFAVSFELGGVALVSNDPSYPRITQSPIWLHFCFYWFCGVRQNGPGQVAMRITLIIIGIAALLLCMCVVSSQIGHSQIRFRRCGHAEDRWDKLERITGRRIRWGPTHCCSSASMINDLRGIEAAQAVYQLDHGRYATCIDELSNDLVILPKFQFRFASDGTNWSVYVPQQGLFAGNYLLTSEHLYFNDTLSPSTNDFDLWR